MIEVLPHNPEWLKQFQQIKDRVWPQVQGHALAIEHVGSTSVPDLAAKPVIDIAIIVKSKQDSLKAIDQLKTVGYEHRGDLGIRDREAFYAPAGTIRHNLYVALNESLSLKNHLLLRNFLLKNPGVRDEYSQLKLTLAHKFPDSIDLYCEGKTQFIVGILKQLGLTQNELHEITLANTVSVATTDRLFLRELKSDDFDFLYDLFRNPEVMKYYPYLRNREQTSEWLQFNLDHTQKYGYGKWIIVKKENLMPIGHTGIVMIDVDGVPELELGYFLDSSCWGLGYATESAKAALKIAFTKLKNPRVVSTINPLNLPSIAVAERLGMQREKTGCRARAGGSSWDCDLYVLKGNN